jgi:hypothetical protein
MRRRETETRDEREQRAEPRDECEPRDERELRDERGETRRERRDCKPVPIYAIFVIMSSQFSS